MQGHTINPLGQKSTVGHPGGPKCIARCIPQMMNFCMTVNCTNKVKKGDRKSFFLITHLVEEDHKANKRWLDSWLARCTKNLKPVSYRPFPCALITSLQGDQPSCTRLHIRTGVKRLRYFNSTTSTDQLCHYIRHFDPNCYNSL